jgi:lysophospholipase L1-like esterase
MIRLAVLGDSIGAGQGASRHEDTISARLVAGLAAAGFEAEARVFAVGGARSAALRGQVERALTWSPNVAVVVIGANDVTHQSPPEEAAAALADAVRRLRARGARVVVAPAPDLSSVPHVPAALRPVVRAASERLRARQVRAAAAEGALVADRGARTARAFSADQSLFSADRFHPSSAGYAVIAAELLPLVLEAASKDAQDT